MSTVASLVHSIRSKNAGPFWLTIDLFCQSEQNYRQLVDNLPTSRVAQALDQSPDNILRFDMASLKVIKFSLPRPVVQGSRLDRDLHGAQWATLIAEISIKPD